MCHSCTQRRRNAPVLRTLYPKKSHPSFGKRPSGYFCLWHRPSVFSTDTAAALRASEIEADIILKATVVDGVYDKDPKKHCDAVRYKTVSHDEVLRLSLGIMDATAAALCRDNRVAIAVFDISDPQNIIRIVDGDGIGTIIS